jgi:hypothetical protein
VRTDFLACFFSLKCLGWTHKPEKNVITFLGLWAKGWKEGLKREIKEGIREGRRNDG